MLNCLIKFSFWARIYIAKTILIIPLLTILTTEPTTSVVTVITSSELSFIKSVITLLKLSKYSETTIIVFSSTSNFSKMPTISSLYSGRVLINKEIELLSWGIIKLITNIIIRNTNNRLSVILAGLLILFHILLICSPHYLLLFLWYFLHQKWHIIQK